MPIVVRQWTAKIIIYVFVITQQAGLVYGATVSADATTKVYQSSNGTTVVDISSANSKGLSHNKFLDYDVSSKGKVLNNTTASGLVHSSQLAGSVPANQYSNRQADIILNEVITSNTSDLLGYTEVVGRKADVIVANPNGITCNGCGFINTNQVSLTTGNPLIDGTGNLNGFDVRKGTVRIGRNGADLTKQEKFNIVARKIVVDGKITMDLPNDGGSNGVLQLVSGVNQWDYKTGDVVEGSGDSSKPEYGIDSTAFGGMYAGKITFKATENGVGVRMLSEAASSADDFLITADGNIEIKSNLSSAKDIRMIASNSADEVTITGEEARIAAANNIVIDAEDSNLTLNDATVYAEGSVDIKANKLTDLNASQKQRIANSGSIKVNVADDLTTTNSVWKAQNGELNFKSNSDLNADDIKVDADSVTIVSDIGDVNISKFNIESERDVTLKSLSKSINLLSAPSAGQNDFFVKSIRGDINIEANNNLVNYGLINAEDGFFNIKSAVFNNYNKIQSKKAMLIDVGSVDNDAEISSFSDLKLVGNNAVLDGKVEASGNVNVNLTDALSLNNILSSK